MLPYEILVGFRGTMCMCARSFIGRTSLKHLNVEIQSLYNRSALLEANKFSLPLTFKAVNTSSVRRFHTQLLANCHASPKDVKPVDTNVISELENDPLDNLVDFATINQQKNAKYKNNLALDKITEPKIPEAVKKWLLTDIEKCPSREIEKQFLEPKVFLHNIFTVVANETKIPQPLTFHSKSVNLNKKKLHWSASYDIKWPEQRSFTSTGHSKTAAASSAALKCLFWLKLNNRIQNRFPVIYVKNEALSVINTPEELKVDQNIVKQIENFLDKYEKVIKETLFSEKINSENDKILQTEKPSESRKQHPISLYQVNEETRNTTLKQRLENRTGITNPDLPIFQYKSQILKELEENQALVIKGDTGCGKTTQVPQFIMDHFTEKGRASDCSMLVTQPRRISAISLAHRIAVERGEHLGDVVGYQVRLQQVLPRQNGAILFCTTGVLLKKMQHNINLRNCSHIIVDEAHERNVDTDMLLVLLKRALKENPSLKVVIMSATINADLFQDYLGCNAVEVPGRLFPVQMNFLDDLKNLGFNFVNSNTNESEEGSPNVDCNEIANLIRWIAMKKPPGAILCFLPGWSHIQRIQRNLEEYPQDIKQIVIPLHSKIPYETQKQIFDSVPDGVRKIILATDIAETGITVPDVVYVVDSACRKEVRWHESKGLSSIDTHWVAKANINQRKGRAGRVQKGESFHLISKLQYEELEQYPLPEVLRMSLEKTVLDAKTYSHEKAEDFLGSMPQPPRLTAVKRAVNDLQVLGALDNDENLTALGKRIAMFAVHPKLSKAMVYSAIFQCLSPITTVSAALSLDSEIFYGTLTNKSRIRDMKSRFHPTSDHIAIAWMYAQWASFLNRGPKAAYDFARRHSLHSDRMNILHKVRDINVEHLRETGLVNDIRDSVNLQSPFNEYAALDELVRGILLAGMDQVLKYRNFEFRKGRLTRTGSSMVTEDNAKAQLSPECINYKRTSWPSPFLVYYQKTHHHERRTTLIRESSMISPVTVLLFSQGKVSGKMHKDENGFEDKVLLTISGKPNVNLICDQLTADVILRFRDIMWLMARYYVENNVDMTIGSYEDEPKDIYDVAFYKRQMMENLAVLLSSASDPIDEIQKNNSALSKENPYR